ncbi:MAG: Response regulator of zinc sigma-54-dependent two-component system [Ignavibacteriae bacterium]|nr:MAG: Response regulator of zinc sigma-54-dependent two-component system [Ignavibacteriota bacterium]
MEKIKIPILIADDEEEFRYMLKMYLESLGYDVSTVSDGVQAINVVQEKAFDLALLDIKMPKVDGIDVLKFFKENFPNIEVIMLTGVDDVKIAVECMKLGAYDYLIKPYSGDELVKIIRKVLEKQRLVKEYQLIKAELQRLAGESEIVGQSQKFKETLDIALKVAPTESTVLIQGHSGTGKELIANFIYKNSRRADKPFVVLNCASLPDTLIESELFGHEKGSFTDAHTMKQGLVELADGGTLFLDEVGDISPIVQPKLLRFIQSGEFRRVGGNIVLKADVRIISATNKNLFDEVKQGKFREDLLYRLNVITITVPPLKDRKDDIPLLVEYFLTKKMRTRSPKKVSEQAMEILMQYSWPGNIRELENVLERAAILAKGDTIQPSDLSLAPNLTQKAISSSADNLIGNRIPIKEIEKLHIEGVLRNLKGNKVEAAKVLGISLKTLYTKIHQYQIEIE